MSKIIVQNNNIIIANEESFLFHSIKTKEFKYVNLNDKSNKKKPVSNDEISDNSHKNTSNEVAKNTTDELANIKLNSEDKTNDKVNSEEGIGNKSNIDESTNKLKTKIKSFDKDIKVSFTCCTISYDNNLLAFQSNEKILHVYNINNWDIIYSKILSRGASKILFTSDNKNLIIGDKTGDVYLINIYNSKEILLLGHLSMILDIIITNDLKYILTCDRDEKIRVSNYPNCYNIENYCLGHKSFITNIKFVSHDNNLLLSSSGDCTIKLWNYLTGKNIDTFDFIKEIKDSIQEEQENVQSEESINYQIKCFSCIKINNNESLICFTLFKCHLIYILLLKHNKFNYINKIKLNNEVLDLQLSSNDTNELPSQISLWVLQNNNEIIIYNSDINNLIFELQIEENLNNINLNLKQFNSNNNIDSIIYVLQKRKMDEVNDYYTKKQARIEEKKKKKIK